MEIDSPVAPNPEWRRQEEEPMGRPASPSVEMGEPEQMGGEPPCYAHLLDDEGNLLEDGR